MHDHGTPPDSINEEEVGSQMALGEPTPRFATLPEAVLTKRRWERLTGDQDIEDVLERLKIKFGVLTSVSVVALEAREND